MPLFKTRKVVFINGDMVISTGTCWLLLLLLLRLLPLLLLLLLLPVLLLLLLLLPLLLLLCSYRCSAFLALVLTVLEGAVRALKPSP